MTDPDLKQANKRVARSLLVLVGAMFSFGFILVPLYDVFCDITGLNGKTGVVELEQALSGTVDKDRLVTVEFVATVNGALPWNFRPMVKKMKVHPGEIAQVNYYAENRAKRTIIGQAVPSVAPGLASKYFNKTECFCFTQQVFGPGEGREMPVRFVVAPDLPPEINTLTLSYTFFHNEEKRPDESGVVRTESEANENAHPAWGRRGHQA